MKVKIEMEGNPQEIADCLKSLGMSGVQITPTFPNPHFPDLGARTVVSPHYPTPWDTIIVSGDPPDSIGSESTTDTGYPTIHKRAKAKAAYDNEWIEYYVRAQRIGEDDDTKNVVRLEEADSEDSSTDTTKELI